MSVFVLDCNHRPLDPCSEKRARLLRERGRAVVHRVQPYTIRLKDRSVQESVVHPYVLKLDPGSKSRIGNVLSWTVRFRRWCPISRIAIERTKFDPQLLNNPEIMALDYQRGTLFGWELRAYVLATWKYQCAYCNAGDRPLELDHVVPRSRHGSNRVSNLVACCRACNERKGDQPLEQFLAGRPALLARIQAQQETPLRDAAAMNAVRYALVERLRATGLSVETSSGGRTAWNREQFGLPKAHALDALCVGQIAAAHGGRARTLLITAMGRGMYCRTNVDAAGFPRGYLPRQKQVHGIQTGDLVEALVPPPRKTAGRHRGRVAVRTSGSFRLGHVDGIGWKYCRVLQKVDGYDYQLQEQAAALPLRR